MLSRIGGKLCFATIRDGTGDIQVMISLDRVGEEALAAWKSDVDLGDHIGVEGEVITSRSGELSVLADSFAITAKALRPLPDKHAGLSDPQARVRQRYVDLIVNPDARQMAELRATVTRSLREELHARGFLEAETPVLQVLHGGANARPFVTHSNAYDIELYLRIALELYLKRLVVGGHREGLRDRPDLPQRGRGRDPQPRVHHARGVRGLRRLHHDRRAHPGADPGRRASPALGSTIVRRPDGSEHDIGGDWPFVGVHEAIVRGARRGGHPGHRRGAPARAVGPGRRPPGAEVEPRPGRARAVRAPGRGAHGRADLLPRLPGRGVAADPRSTGPTRGSPSGGTWSRSAPRSARATPSSSTRCEQRERLTAQSLLAAGGDPEAMQLDEDFLRALEYGMPPSGGMGMGVDRLLIMLTGAEHQGDGAVPVRAAGLTGGRSRGPGFSRARAAASRPSGDQATISTAPSKEPQGIGWICTTWPWVGASTIRSLPTYMPTWPRSEEEQQVARLELALRDVLALHSTGHR